MVGGVAFVCGRGAQVHKGGLGGVGTVAWWARAGKGPSPEWQWALACTPLAQPDPHCTTRLGFQRSLARLPASPLQGTQRGAAAGFKLDTLLKLADVKGTDRKTSLLHFVITQARGGGPSCSGGLGNELRGACWAPRPPSSSRGGCGATLRSIDATCCRYSCRAAGGGGRGDEGHERRAVPHQDGRQHAGAAGTGPARLRSGMGCGCWVHRGAECLGEGSAGQLPNLQSGAAPKNYSERPAMTPLPPSPPLPSPQLAAIKGLIGEVRLGLRQINTEVVQVSGGGGSIEWATALLACVELLRHASWHAGDTLHAAPSVLVSAC